MKRPITIYLLIIFSATLFLNSCNDDDCTKTAWYLDADGDGYGNPDVSTQACVQPDGYVSNSLDCDDNDALINPDATEICDGIDNDCDGLIDDEDPDFDPTELGTWYIDNDGDGYGNPAPAFIIVSCTQPDGYVSNNLDCNDNNPLINPDAVEICDGVDNNCNGLTDLADPGLDLSTATTYYKDDDGDGYGNPDEIMLACSQPLGYVSNNLDCDDTDFDVNPGVAEIPGDGIDNNCNGEIDENCVPDCSGKMCGDDGCGGSCGSCPGPFICNPSGICE